MKEDLVKCPVCESVNVDLTEHWVNAQTWSQSSNGVSEDFKEEIVNRTDDFIRAKCLECGCPWGYEGSVDV